MSNIYYTDGAQSSKDLVGGWAVVYISDEAATEAIVEYGYEETTTNNRMELTAVCHALLAFNEEAAEAQEPLDCRIYTDSAYIANCFAQKWYERWQHNGWKTAQRTPVVNKDLWERILQLYNKMADSYAVRARTHKENKILEIHL